MGLWRNRDFIKLWVGQTISNIGSGITGVALPLTAVLILAASPVQMGILGALNGLAVLAFGLFAGVWVDRLRRRPIMIAADLGRAALLGSIPLAALLGVLNLAQLYVVAALSAILTIFFNVADQSFLPTLVPQKQLVEANSKRGTSDSLAEICGPASAGPLVQLIGAPFAILLDACSFLVSAFSIALIRVAEPRPVPEEKGLTSFRVNEGDPRVPAQPFTTPAPTAISPASTESQVKRQKQSAWRESIDGLRMIRHNALLRALATSAALFEFFGNFVATLYILYIVRELHASALILGFLIATGGVSALLGTLIARRVIQRLGPGLSIGAMLTFYGASGLVIPLAHGPVMLAVAFLFAGQLCGDASVAIYFIAEVSLRQAIIPNAFLGRISASMQFLTQGPAPVAAIVAGILGTVIGLRLTILIGVVGVILAGVLLILSPVSRVRSLAFESGTTE